MIDDEQAEKETAILKPRNGFALTGLILGIASVLQASIGIIPILAIDFSGIGLAKVEDQPFRQGQSSSPDWSHFWYLIHTCVYVSV